ncbi:putative ligase [Salmonella enterica subsp. arizonae]|uniref:5-formyltetrahydrofolate cyclo-ligase n=1 Tax=Salmonella enterica subsp. arizonae TaxID=59203 RepID=A0A379T5I4_SALER|nr:putative ligase [Salmonella enterica subsp. arizonae]
MFTYRYCIRSALETYYFLHYHPHSELVTNRLKIQEPKLDVRDVLPLSQLDVLVTPLVAFDEDGQRLGMGGGFYDRTLQNWPSHGLTPVGYAHDCQRVEKLPVEGVGYPAASGSDAVKSMGMVVGIHCRVAATPYPAYTLIQAR